MRILINLSLSLTLGLLASHQAWGFVYLAPDCTLTSVQLEVNAAVTGDTVQIPAGSATWTSGLTILNKGINLVGAGVGKTIITNAWTVNVVRSGLIDAQHNYPNFVRISGITILNSSGTYADVNVGGTSQTDYFRIDHMQFLNMSKTGITANGYDLGVIDHCDFSSIATGGATGVSITGEGAYSWDVRPPTWGDTNKVYIEDCTFNWSLAALNANGAVDSYNGARWCFRYNWVTNINVGDHGTDSSGLYRATHSFEVYNNFFTNTSTIPSSAQVFFSFRGGTGIFFSNAAYGYVQPVINILNYRNSGTNVYGAAQGDCCQPWGPINGINPLDGNTDPYGWPAYDTVGRTSPTIYYTNVPTPSYTNYYLDALNNGTNLMTWLQTAPYDYTTNDFGLIYTNLSMGTNGYTVQAAQPTYGWSNICPSGALAIHVGNVYTNTGTNYLIPSDSAEIQAGRDYFDNTVMTNYVINGISYPYVPLVHPHPLVSAAVLLPPSNLHVVP